MINQEPERPLLCRREERCLALTALEVETRWIAKFYDIRLEYEAELVKVKAELMDERMKGFPAKFVQRGDIEAILANLTAKVDGLVEFKQSLSGIQALKSREILMWSGVVVLVISCIGLLLRYFKI